MRKNRSYPESCSPLCETGLGGNPHRPKRAEFSSYHNIPGFDGLICRKRALHLWCAMPTRHRNWGLTIHRGWPVPGLSRGSRSLTDSAGAGGWGVSEARRIRSLYLPRMTGVTLKLSTTTPPEGLASLSTINDATMRPCRGDPPASALLGGRYPPYIKIASSPRFANSGHKPCASIASLPAPGWR